MTEHADYSAMERALATLSAYGPDLANGLTNHAPMVAEALASMGRADAVMPWIERYRGGMVPRPAAGEPIPRGGWRDALGRTERAAEWSAFFEEELRGRAWGHVLGTWVPRLARGIAASATHGVIRVGHAARSLADADTPARRRELAGGLADWAAAWQPLPASTGAPAGLPAHRAVAAVHRVPPPRRRFDGTIVGALAALDDWPPFAGVRDLLDVARPPQAVVGELTETFARVYLANARDALHAIVFVHGVTSVAALRPILPHLDEADARDLVAWSWQAAAALYATFGHALPAGGEPSAPGVPADTLIDRAVANGDDHAIKLTAACLGEHGRRPSPAYLAAAWHAVSVLGPL